MERVTTLHLEPPNDRQKLFFQCRKKYIAFGGARGGGKSWAVRTKAKLMALGYPGIRLLLVRRSYQELESNHIRFCAGSFWASPSTEPPPGSSFSPTAACWISATAPVTLTWTATRGRNTT